MKHIAQIILGHILVPSVLFFIWKVELVVTKEYVAGYELTNGFFTVEWIIGYHVLMYVMLVISLIAGIQLSADGYRKLTNDGQ